MLRLDLPQQFAAAKFGHPDVSQDNIVSFEVQISECLFGTFGRVSFVSFGKEFVKRVANEGIVVDDEQGSHSNHLLAVWLRIIQQLYR